MSKLKISSNFQKHREKQNTNEGKTGIFKQNRFSTNPILVFGVPL